MLSAFVGGSSLENSIVGSFVSNQSDVNVYSTGRVQEQIHLLLNDQYRKKRIFRCTVSRLGSLMHSFDLLSRGRIRKRG